jgi:hypothetical protein
MSVTLKIDGSCDRIPRMVDFLVQLYKDVTHILAFNGLNLKQKLPKFWCLHIRRQVNLHSLALFLASNH